VGKFPMNNIPVSEDMVKHVKAEPVFPFLTEYGLISHRLALSRKPVVFSVCY